MTNTTTNYVTSKTITEEQIEDTNKYCGYDRGTRFLCPQGFAFYYNQHRINNLDLCDADRYAFLNTIMGYDVGINEFREIDSYVWNHDNDLLEFTGDDYDKAMVEAISESANLNLNFSKWRNYSEQLEIEFNKRKNGEEVKNPFTYSYFEDGIEYNRSEEEISNV